MRSSAPRRPAGSAWGLRHPRMPRILPIGVVLIAATVLVGLALGPRDESSRLAPVRLLAEDCGRIVEWTLFLGEDDGAYFMPTQADLVRKADPAIRFRIVHGDGTCRQAFERQLAEHGGPGGRAIEWIRVAGTLAPWVRDYFLMAQTPDGEAAYLAHAPAHLRAMRYGRSATPAAALRALRAMARGDLRATDLQVDGGAVVANGRQAFVSSDARDRALAAGRFHDAAAYVKHLATVWGLPVEVLDLGGLDAAHHVDLYVMPAGPGHLVLGSPRLATDLLDAAGAADRRSFTEGLRSLVDGEHPRDALRLLGRIDVVGRLIEENRAPRRLRAFAAVRRRLEALGYRCTEVPLLFLEAARSGAPLTLSYANGIQDLRGGRRTIYLPTYRFPLLDRAARAAWTRLGYHVVGIDALGPAIHGGAVHCLSHVVRRP